MTFIQIEDLKPGMVLAEDIRDRHGRFLLGRDLAITDKHLRIFRIWGINQVNIKDSKDEGPDETSYLDPELWSLARKEALGGFPEYNADDPLCRDLLKIFSRCRYNQLQQGLTENHLPSPLNQTDECPQPEASGVDCLRSISSDLKLCSLPRIFFLIQEAIQDPRTSSRHIADIISKDQALTASLLRLVNSAYYGFPSRIDTISRAVTIIGTRQLSTLALGLSVISKFKNIPPEIMDMESFWKHSIACAIGARTLAGLARLPGTESFFVCGLLHDLGKLIMLDQHPRTYHKVLLWAGYNQTRLTRAEKKFFRHDHTYIGGYILKTWKLPLKIEQAVRYHENPVRARFQTEAAMVHMANVIATGCLLGNAGETVISAPDSTAWERCGLDNTALYECSRLMLSQVDNIYNLIFSHV